MQNTIAPLQQGFLESEFERLCFPLTFASAERVIPVFMLTQEMQEAIWITSSPARGRFRAHMSGDLTAAVYEFFEQCRMHFGFRKSSLQKRKVDSRTFDEHQVDAFDCAARHPHAFKFRAGSVVFHRSCVCFLH